MPNELIDELEGVIPDSPPETEVDEPAGDPKAESAEGKKPERDYDQLHREFDRKIGKLGRDINQKLEAIAAKVNVRGEQSTPSDETGDILDKYKLSDLRGMRSQVTDEGQLKQLDDYITKRTVKETVSAELQSFKSTESFKQRKDDANRTAVTRYPELLDEKSDFYANVQAKMSAEGSEYRSTNPRAILDIANDVAAELGTPARATVRGRRPGTVVTRKDSADPADAKDKPLYSDEMNNAISKRLSRALPAGSKGFKMDQIKKEQSEYNKHKDLIIRG